MTKARMIVTHEAPQIFIDPLTYQQGMYITGQHTTEIAWLAQIKEYKDPETDKTWAIQVHGDIFIPEQEVNGATVEVDDWGKLLNEIDEAGIDISTVRAWHHSHNTMAVVPSGQDLAHAKEFYDEWGSAGGYFLSLIFNHKEQVSIGLYDWTLAMAWDDVGFTFPSMVSDERKASLDALCKERVSLKTYAPSNQYSVGGTWNTRTRKWEAPGKKDWPSSMGASDLPISQTIGLADTEELDTEDLEYEELARTLGWTCDPGGYWEPPVHEHEITMENLR